MDIQRWSAFHLHLHQQLTSTRATTPRPTLEIMPSQVQQRRAHVCAGRRSLLRAPPISILVVALQAMLVAAQHRRVLLSDMDSITLRRGSITTGRRSSGTFCVVQSLPLMTLWQLIISACFEVKIDVHVRTALAL